jgi:hypothetical protein
MGVSKQCEPGVSGFSPVNAAFASLLKSRRVRHLWSGVRSLSPQNRFLNDTYVLRAVKKLVYNDIWSRHLQNVYQAHA